MPARNILVEELKKLWTDFERILDEVDIISYQAAKKLGKLDEDIERLLNRALEEGIITEEAYSRILKAERKYLWELVKHLRRFYGGELDELQKIIFENLPGNKDE
jgi:hypothetical protein